MRRKYEIFLKKGRFHGIYGFRSLCPDFFPYEHDSGGGTAELILKHTLVGLEESATEEQLSQISNRYNLDDPLYLQFFRWVKEALLRGGDIGTSYVYKNRSFTS